MIHLPRKKPRWLFFSFIFRSRWIPVHFLGLRRTLKILLDLDKAIVFLANSLAAKYNQVYDIEILKNEVETIASYFPKSIGVIDLGCGDGVQSFLLGELGYKVIGVDYSETSIFNASKSSTPNCRFICADILSFLNNSSASFESYELVFMSHILEHIDDPISLLTLLLVNFSFIYVEVPDFQSCPLNSTRLRVGSRLYSDDDHVWEFDLNSLLKLMYESGWEHQYSFVHDGVISYYGHSFQGASKN